MFNEFIPKKIHCNWLIMSILFFFKLIINSDAVYEPNNGKKQNSNIQLTSFFEFSNVEKISTLLKYHYMKIYNIFIVTKM